VLVLLDLVVDAGVIEHAGHGIELRGPLHGSFLIEYDFDVAVGQRVVSALALKQALSARQEAVERMIEWEVFRPQLATDTLFETPHAEAAAVSRYAGLRPDVIVNVVDFVSRAIGDRGLAVRSELLFRLYPGGRARVGVNATVDAKMVLGH
jgi:hypothetical protein